MHRTEQSTPPADMMGHSAESARQRLQELTAEAGRLLSEESACHTEADRKALTDMVIRAEKAMAGKKAPFTRNRAFFRPEEEQEILFACDRYTMAPAAFEEGKVYGHYGLRQAIAWFRDQDMARWDAKRLADRAKEVLERCRALLEKADYGDHVGSYDRTCAVVLRRQMEKLTNIVDFETEPETADVPEMAGTPETTGAPETAGTPETADIPETAAETTGKEGKEKKEKKGKKEKAQVLADTIDAYLRLRFSQKLRSDVEKQPVLLLPGDVREKLQAALRLQNAFGKEEERRCDQAEKEALRPRNALGTENAFETGMAQYRAICEIADRKRMEESRIAYEQIWEKHSYEELNRSFSIWGDTGKVVNLVTPAGTQSAVLTFRLPGEENEESGLGHVLVTGVRILCADGPEVEVPNGDFAQKQTAGAQQIPHWRREGKGGAVCRQERDTAGNTYLFLCNPKAGDEAAVVCEDKIPLTGNHGYTLFFRAKQDGKFRQGLQATLTFLDGAGRRLGQFTHVYNRKSVLPAGPKALTMQCGAIRYALERDVEYARMAKHDMLTFLNDFCQGAEYWMIHNERPEGCDAYGAVQAGRILCTVASTFSLIRPADIFSKEEQLLFYELTEYLLQYCMDMRDRISMSPERAQRGSSNWQTDMCIGVAAMMMVLPDYPERRTWLYNAEAVLEAQLSMNLNRDGSWPESIRYHHAALEHFASFAAMWEQETGEDWLVTTRLKEMFAYTIHTVTPPYVFFDGCVGTPPFGDHRLSGGTELGIYGLYIAKMERIDKKLADEMYQVWLAAKCPVKKLSGESLAVENLLYLEPSAYRIAEENRLSLQSSADYPDSGIYIMRNGRPQENYLAVMAPAKPIGHGHLDTGSFLLYHHNYPVIMDTGIEGYFDASTQWHLSSYAHACLQFAATGEDDRTFRKEQGTAINLSAGNYSLDRGWLDVPGTCRVTEVKVSAGLYVDGEAATRTTDIECEAAERRSASVECEAETKRHAGISRAETKSGEAESAQEWERITMEIAHPAGRERGIHMRTILFEKESGDVIIRDRVENFHGEMLFSLPMVMHSARIEGSTVYANGWYPLKMTVEFLSPVERITLEQGRSTPLFPTDDDTPMLLYVRAKARAKDGVEVRIHVDDRCA